MRAAVITISSAAGTVSNIIVADASRDSVAGAILVDIPDGTDVGEGYFWDSAIGFTAPSTVSVSTATSR